MGFSDQEREAELKRLSELGDESFSATEAAYERMLRVTDPKVEKKVAAQKETGTDNKGKKSSAKADDDDKVMRTDAGVNPLSVDDKNSTLEDKLKTGFKAAYEERVGLAA